MNEIRTPKQHFGTVNGMTPGVTPVELRITNIHDFLHLNTGDVTRNKQLNALSHLIHCQADMHEAVYHGDPNQLGRAIQNRASTFRGFIVHTTDGRPAAYCVYYPMVDADGKRAAYCEDIYVVQAWRGLGIFSIVLGELSRRTMAEGLSYVQWSTDARNIDFLAASKKKGIIRAAIHKWDCSNMSSPEFCDKVAGETGADTSYMARPLTQNDIYQVGALDFAPDLITNTGDLDFRGFIVFHKDDRNTPVAVVPGWKRLSTFRLVEDIVLEQPRIKDGHDVTPILLAVAEASRKAVKNGTLLWHIHDGENPELERVLATHFHAHPETMAGTPESAMITHVLGNGNLRALAEAKPNLLIAKRADSPIGASVGVAAEVARPAANMDEIAHPMRRAGDRPKTPHA